jgi:long-chain acyl-CoA synthetase
MAGHGILILTGQLMYPMISPDSIQEFLDRVQEVDPEQSSAAGESPFLAIAEQWQAMGIRPGDLVLFCLPNGKTMLGHFFGALLAGGVPAPVGPNTPSTRLREVARAMNACAIVSLRPLPAEFVGASTAMIGGARLYRFESDAPPAAAPGEVVLLTSGTSGFASGCLHDISSLLINAERHAQSIGQRDSDTVLVNLPLYFSFALVAQALASFVRGNRLIIGGPPFHVPTYTKALTEFGVTISSLTPVLVRPLMNGHAPLPSSLRVLTIGGDTLATQHVEELLRRRPGKELYLTYGLTQAGPRVSTLAAHAEPASRHGSVGLPLAGTRVHLQEVAGAPGMKQLFVSSGTVMKRRIGLSEGHVHDAVPSQGTVATGDIFEQDTAGYLFFQGRLSDYIVRHGEKVCLAAVRRVAMRFPNVIRARTLVTKHDYGEDFELVLDTADGAEGDYVDLLRSWLRRSEMPRAIRVVNNADARAAAYK